MMFKSALLILSGQAFGSLIGLVRNLLVARLISVEDYGIAATFVITMSLIEMVTSLGLNQLIIQDKAGNDPRLQAGLQGFNLMRSILSGGTIFLLAGPIASFLGTEDIVWAYQLLGLMPVLTGFYHFDIYRLQRKMTFLPSIIASLVPNAIGLLLIWPLYLIWQDFRVMLFALLAQTTLAVVMSHVVAERPYRLTIDRPIIAQSFRFGWPLLINNLLLFFIFQGEKVIVGRELGVEALGHFAMGMTLTLTPALVLGGAAQTFFLPQLAARKDEPEVFRHLAITTFETHMAFGITIVIGVMLLGGPVISLLLGAKYSDLVPLMTWLALLQSLRLFRGGSATVALAMGRTSIATISNIPRVIAMPIAWYVVAQGGSLVVLLWIAIASEALGFLISLQLVHRQLRISLNSLRPVFGFCLILLALVWLHRLMDGQAAEPYYHPDWTGPAIFVAFLLALASMKDLRRYIMNRAVAVEAEPPPVRTPLKDNGTDDLGAG